MAVGYGPFPRILEPSKIQHLIFCFTYLLAPGVRRSDPDFLLIVTLQYIAHSQ